MTQKWLLLVYKVPPEPSARRVYVWRKLKRLGAYLLHDAVWVLPATPQTREQLQWLGVEIGEMVGGTAYVWEAEQVFAVHPDHLRQIFSEQTDTAYQEILAALQEPDADAVALARRYQQVKSQDYFQSNWAEEVRTALLKARGENGEKS